MATFVMNVSRNRKMKKLAYFPRYWLDLAQIWCRGYFWILNPKSTIKFLYDVILTSKWREDKMPIYHLQKMHTSSWHHLWSNFLENVALEFALCPRPEINLQNPMWTCSIWWRDSDPQRIGVILSSKILKATSGFGWPSFHIIFHIVLRAFPAFAASFDNAFDHKFLEEK